MINQQEIIFLSLWLNITFLSKKEKPTLYWILIWKQLDSGYSEKANKNLICGLFSVRPQRFLPHTASIGRCAAPLDQMSQSTFIICLYQTDRQH